MTCADCAALLESQFWQMQGVVAVSVSSMTGTVRAYRYGTTPALSWASGRGQVPRGHTDSCRAAAGGDFSRLHRSGRGNRGGRCDVLCCAVHCPTASLSGQLQGL
jgi:hypothetical protein